MKNAQGRAPTVLGVSANTYGMGYAALDGPRDILETGVTRAAFFGYRSCVNRLRALASFYQPDLIAIESNRGKGLVKGKVAGRVFRAITEEAKRLKIPIIVYTRDDVIAVFEQFQAPTRYQIAKRITEWLPELTPKLPRRRNFWDTKDINLSIFDAVAVALVHYHNTQ